jgi:hypothetical protein
MMIPRIEIDRHDISKYNNTCEVWREAFTYKDAIYFLPS